MIRIQDECNKKILLVGNPNVGKSVLFSRLTGVHAISSNYPGTTVSFTQGRFRHGDECYQLIDVPGAYTLDPTNEAEMVAKRIIEEGCDIVILTIDACALERNLYLALQVIEKGANVIVALNMVDEARHEGIQLNIEALEKELGVPVVPTVAVSGHGISELVNRLPESRPGSFLEMDPETRWKTIGKIIGKVQTVTHRHHSLKDRFEDASVHPFWGAVIGATVILASFMVIRRLGEGAIDLVFDPIFESFLLPVLNRLSTVLGPGSLFHSLLLGTLIDGSLDFEQSFGLLTTGLYVPIVMVLPYVVAFYAVLSLLEDSGYLPRLAVLFDSLMHKVGLHGFAIVPNLLGLGCNVPGILATRVLESPRERFIAATLISVAVPCAGLQAMIFGALGTLGGKYVLMVYGALVMAWVILGKILHALLPGYSPELVVEIPPYRVPSLKGLGFKLWFRVKGFIFEAIPLVLLGVLLVNGLYLFGVMDVFSQFLDPFFRTVLGLPSTAVGPILLGLLRKDVAVGMLLPLGLEASQLVIAVVVLAMTFPCIATFIVLWKELGLRKMFASVGVMILTALAAGASLNALFLLLG
ncbi:MAG TPA: ferrous iron transporter B [Synergistaceae bacterium]|nr:ferrous iron transporter B [Synergistaceae bacterium]